MDPIAAPASVPVPQLLVSIDGNIGAGKSTVMEYIHKNVGMAVNLEQVDNWMPYLERVYKHDDGVFDLQVRVWLDRCFIKRPTHGTVLVERSPMFQAGVFVPVNAEKFTPNQAAILKDMYALPDIMSPDVYIYLRSDPAKCAERINHRARESEDSIPIKYLNEIHLLHEATYMEALADNKQIAVIDIEGKSVATIAAQVLESIYHVVNNRQ